jgi:hypothetical protein
MKSVKLQRIENALSSSLILVGLVTEGKQIIQELHR